MENKHKKKSWLDGFMIWLLAALRKSFLGRFFTSYYSANEKFIKKISGKKRSSEKHFARFIEKNRIIGFVPKMIEFLLRIPLRDYGIAMFMTGAVVAALYPLNGMILFIDITFELFVLGVSVSTCSIPLLFSSRSIASSILSSRLFSFILFDFLGMDDEGIRVASEKPTVSFATFSFLIGTGLGVASYFITPVGTVLLYMGVILAYCTIRTPEVGAIISVLLVPFANIYVVCGCVAYTFLCYVIKVKLGKRVFKFEYFDLWVSIAIVVFTVCGFNYVHPLLSLENVLTNLVILMSYFLYANLIYSKVWFRRSIVAFTSSSLIVAIIAVAQGVLRYIAGSVESVGKLFPPDGDVVSTLGSTTVLAQFMVIAIPFALVHMISEKRDISKFVGFILAAVLITALVLTNSAIGLFGLLIGTLLIFAFFKRKAIYLIVLVAIALPILYFTLPEGAIAAITSKGPFEGVSIKDELSYLLDSFVTVIKSPFGYNLHGTISMDLYGADSFDSMPIQMLASYGIIGFVAFVSVLIMFIRVILSYSVQAKNVYRRVNGCAGFCSVLALMSVGIFSDVWADKRIFLIFVITIALSLAYVKIDRDEEAVKDTRVDITTASIEILLKENPVNTIPQRRTYIHLPKIKKKAGRIEASRQAEAKEFTNTQELFSVRNEDENENSEEQRY